MNRNRNLQSPLLRERLQAHWPDRGRAPVAAKIALPIAGARTRSLVRAIGLALSRPSFLFAARGHLPGPSKVGQGMRTMLRRRGRQLPGRVPGRHRRGGSWRRSESQAARPLPRLIGLIFWELRHRNPVVNFRPFLTLRQATSAARIAARRRGGSGLCRLPHCQAQSR